MGLRDRLDQVVTSWQPEQGDQIIGTVIELGWRDTEHGGYRLVTIRVDEEGATQDGEPIGVGEERCWHAFGAVPKRELKRLQPRVGDRIAARKLGMQAGKGNEFMGWTIVAERDGKPLEPKPDTQPIAAAEPSDEIQVSERPDFASDGEASSW
jgi:hypothetical protein